MSGSRASGAKEIRGHVDVVNSQQLGDEFPNSNEYYGFENNYNGNGLMGIRDSLDMAWLTSMPHLSGQDENVNLAGTFEW